MTLVFEEPALKPEEGWIEYRSPFEELEPSFVSNEAGSQSLRTRYYRRGYDDALVGKAWFGPKTKGPPGHAHGGSVAALLDDAMGSAAWLAGKQVVAARITIEFKEMLPLRTEVIVEAYVARVEGRKVFTEGKVLDRSGKLFATGSGLFVSLTEEQLKKLAPK